MTKLQIELSAYGPSKGQFVGRVYFENDYNASVEIPLSDEVSRKVLAVCAEQVVQAGKDTAAMIVAEVIEATNEPKLIE
jgi:hypothetical protein